MDNRTKKEISAVNKWNDENKIGTNVSVLMDNGESRITKTRSNASMLGANSQHPGHTAVIFLDGITGSYKLSRVSVIAD